MCSLQSCLKLDVSLDQHAVFRAEMLLQGFERCNAARGILLAIAAAQADAADYLAVDHNREASDEYCKAAFKAPLDPKSFVARQGRTVRRLIEQMGRAFVAGGGEGLVPSDLWAGNSRAVHALNQDGMTAVIGDADRLENLDLVGFRDGRRRHQRCLGALELECLSHVVVSSGFEFRYRDRWF